MGDIHNFKVVNPSVSNKKPFIDKRGNLYIPLTGARYRYFLEVSNYDPDTGDDYYYIMFGNIKFNEHCRLCAVDMYGRVQVPVKGVIKDYILRETKERGNVEVKYLESTENYDIFSVE